VRAAGKLECSIAVRWYYCGTFYSPPKIQIVRGKHPFIGGRLKAATMAPLSKETLEIPSPATEAPTPRGGGPTKPASGHQRADAVSLEIPVKVHGSRVTQVMRGGTPQTEPFEEQTSTMIVFPQGGVVRMATSVSAGQMLVLTNLKSRQDAICRVVKVRTFANMPGYVEVEFTHPQRGYWGVHFPTDGPRTKSVLPPPPVSPPAEAKNDVTQDISWAPAPTLSTPAAKPPEARVISQEVVPAAVPAPVPAYVPPSAPITPPPAAHVVPSKPESPFIAIGTREDVQLAAAVTSETKAAPLVESGKTIRSHESPRPASTIGFAPATPAVSSPPPPLMPDLRRDEPRALANASAVTETFEVEDVHEAPPVVVATHKASSRPAFGTLSEVPALSGGISASSELFGVRHESVGAVPPSRDAKLRSNWILIAAFVIGGVLVGAGGGMFYFQHRYAHAGAVSATTTVPVATNHAQPGSSNGAQPGSALTQPTSMNSATQASAAVRGNSEISAKPNAPVKQSAPSVTSGMMAVALNTHPVSSQRTGGDQANSAPTLDMSAVSGNEGAALPGIPSSRNVGPPEPGLDSNGPVRVGGEVKQPHQISSAMPVYPSVARAAKVEGDVVIRTTIDERGRVSHMDIVSGPMALRQAAQDALRQWRYQPSLLNGQPISVQMEVTIRFRLPQH
jgi:TonB family protein